MAEQIKGYWDHGAYDLGYWIGYHFWPVILLAIIAGMVMLVRRHVRLHGWKI